MLKEPKNHGLGDGQTPEAAVRTYYDSIIHGIRAGIRQSKALAGFQGRTLDAASTKLVENEYSRITRETAAAPNNMGLLRGIFGDDQAAALYHPMAQRIIGERGLTHDDLDWHIIACGTAPAKLVMSAYAGQEPELMKHKRP